VVIAIAGVRSDQSSLVIYNHTGVEIPVLGITSCGRSVTHRALDSEDSWRWRPVAASAGSEIELELATQPPLFWKGGYLEPRGGQRVTLHLWPGGEVEFHTQVSIWRRWLGGSPDVQE
jgi:hypothetical protein